MLRRSAAQLLLSVQEAAAQRCAQGAPALACGTCTAQARHSSSRPPAAPEADPFTVQLQRRTEDELRALLDKREAQAAPAAEHVEDEEADEEVLVSPTGEVGGPKGAYTGAEPTRFGDWERGGRCTDF